jgi:hypothetical protein
VLSTNTGWSKSLCATDDYSTSLGAQRILITLYMLCFYWINYFFYATQRGWLLSKINYDNGLNHFLSYLQNYFYNYVLDNLVNCGTTKKEIGPGSSVGIATGYGLDGAGIESRWGEIFRTCQDRPSDPPRLLYNGETGFVPGVNSGRGVTLTPHSLLVPLVMKE